VSYFLNSTENGLELSVQEQLPTYEKRQCGQTDVYFSNSHNILSSLREVYTVHKCSACPQNGTQLKGKGKAIPVHAWASPEGSRRLKLPNFEKIGV
jgi:hypothetical protein